MQKKCSSPWRWWTRRRRQIMLAVAVIPLMQVSACSTGLGQVLGGVGNALPSLSFNAVQSVFLLPVEIVLELLTGQSGGSGSSGTGSGGLGSSSGLGGLTGSSGLGSTSGI